MDHDLEEVNNLKLLLCAFEQPLGLKITFHKIKFFCFGQAKEVESLYFHLFRYKLGMFHSDLGNLMHYRMLGNVDWRAVKEMFEKRAFGTNKLSALKFAYVYDVSFFEVPRGVLKMDYIRSHFHWKNNQHKKKNITRWEILCKPKDQGGFGMLDLDTQNKYLLDRNWQCLLRNKYLRNKTCSQIEKKSGDSQFCSRLTSFEKWNLGKVLEYIWLGGVAREHQYPALFNIVRKTMLQC
ncbi:LOW QUALITY PROTEIN: hypothetical protein U9M48_008308 [Paspalum notatum var. saurae]|uniref:Uncharacterized protein n=1 Tax=Paspalum notatum var. saurae TaxID=547442 RepID=A0AAQ3WDE5_PASNO